MAATLLHEKDPYSILTTDPNRDQRRLAGLMLFRDYLLPDQSQPPHQQYKIQAVLEQLGYTKRQQGYLIRPVTYVALGEQKPTDKGLEARPSTDSTSSGPASLVESPVKKLAEFQITLPTNLDWHSRDQLNDFERGPFKDLGALMRLSLVDPTLLGEGDEAALTHALHSGDRFPGLGLRPAGFFSKVALMFGQSSVFKSRRLNERDIEINLQSPGSSPKTELWRELPSMDNDLHVFGRVLQIKG